MGLRRRSIIDAAKTRRRRQAVRCERGDHPRRRRPSDMSAERLPGPVRRRLQSAALERRRARHRQGHRPLHRRPPRHPQHRHHRRRPPDPDGQHRRRHELRQRADVRPGLLREQREHLGAPRRHVPHRRSVRHHRRDPACATTNCSSPNGRSVAWSRHRPRSSGRWTNFINYSGRLDPSTTQNTALETGYEFLADGAELNAKNLVAGGYSSVVRFINDAWTDGALAAALGAFQTSPSTLRRDRPARALRPEQRTARGQQFEEAGAEPIRTPRPGSEPGPTRCSPATSSRRRRTGRSCTAWVVTPATARVTSRSAAPSPDWAQRLVGNMGNVFAGNTGFGYGDSDTVALSESLTAQFATEVAQPGSIGQAWVDAKQQTVSDVHVLDAYQEKVRRGVRLLRPARCSTSVRTRPRRRRRPVRRP